MKLNKVLYTAAFVLVILLPACVKPTGTTLTTQPPLENTPEILNGELVIASTNAFVDSYGTYRVVGDVVNYSSTVLNSIQLAVEIKDASGNSLLKDNNGESAPSTIIYPLLYTLAPGEGSPFEYSYDTTNGTPVSYSVSITGNQTGNANRAALKEENIQLMDIGSDWFYLTGELVNTSNQWAYINSLAGAVLDDSNNVLSTDWTTTYTTVLAPSGDALGRDRTPFEVNFPNPGGSTKWKLYWDADIADDVTDYAMEVEVTNLYFDQYGSAHLIGLITNNSNQPLESMVVGGLYSADGIVLDSNYAFVPIPIRTGESVPFSISSFGSVSYNPNLASQVMASSAQFDSWFTTPPSSEKIDLNATDETVQKDGASWTISGKIVNTSGKNLSYATAVVMVMDSQNKLVAMEYTSISPTGDAIAPGETNTYSVTIYLDPTTNAAGLTTTTVIVGDVK